MHRIIYVSRALGVTEQALDDILAVSRRRNPAVGVTGLLIHCRGTFVQLLEGERDAVEALYARIAVDPRHDEVQAIVDADADARHYPDWSMGFESVDSAQLVTTLLGPLLDASLIPHSLVSAALLERFSTDERWSGREVVGS